MSRISKTDLNPEQYAAATAPDGPALVLAAAGTGKTRTLVYRVVHLVERGVAPDRILLLTFTNRAAGEMLERAHELVGPDVSGIWGGTFHHMANRILRRHAERIRYGTDYTILDRDDSRTLISNCVKARKLQGRDFPKADVLISLFSAAANTESDLRAVIESRYGDAGLSVDPADILHVHEDYEKEKRKLDAMDFDDLLVNGLLLFRNHADILRRYQDQFLHVLVDEYQDTNTIQAELVDRIAGRHRNVFVVGDDFQSIYSWRGANFRNILSFPDRYGETTTYKLETNYRSVPEILEVANACIAGNPEQFQKTLRPTRDAYRRPRVGIVRDGGEQARFLVEQVNELTRAGYRRSEIAVLYRAHYHAMELQMTLTQERIPYIVTSGARFFEQAHIKDVCSVLRILVSPEDFLAFSRLLCFLPGVGQRTAQKCWDRLGGRFAAGDEAMRAVLRDALPAGGREPWKIVEGVLKAYYDEGLTDDGGEVIHRFVETFYEQHAANVFEDFGRRMDDIRELILYTANFPSVERFLSDIALLTNLDAEIEQMAAPQEDCLRLSTVHQAKGQEWPVVILIWMTDGMFPSSRTLAESESGEAEERRLFYVAVTRAKDELLLCMPEVRRTRDGSVQYCTPSRFVQELPEGLCEMVRVGFV